MASKAFKILTFCLTSVSFVGEALSGTPEDMGSCSSSFDHVADLNTKLVVTNYANGLERIRDYLGEWSDTPIIFHEPNKCCALPPSFTNRKHNETIKFGDLVAYRDNNNSGIGKVVDAVRNNDGEVVFLILWVEAKTTYLTSLMGEQIEQLKLANHRKYQFDQTLDDLKSAPLLMKPLMGSEFQFFGRLTEAFLNTDVGKTLHLKHGQWIKFQEFPSPPLSSDPYFKLARVSAIYTAGPSRHIVKVKHMRSDGVVVESILSQNNIKSISILDHQPSEFLGTELVLRTVANQSLVAQSGYLVFPGQRVFVDVDMNTSKSEASMRREGILQSFSLRDLFANPEIANQSIETEDDPGAILMSDGSLLSIWDSVRINSIRPSDKHYEIEYSNRREITKSRMWNDHIQPIGRFRHVLSYADDEALLGSKLFIATHHSITLAAHHKNQNEGQFELWHKHFAEHLNKLGISLSGVGYIIYPDVEGFNYRLGKFFPEFHSILKLSKKLSFIKNGDEYIEHWNHNLAQGNLLLSMTGPEHFQELGMLPAITLIPTEYISDLVSMARLLEAMKYSQPNLRSQVRSYMGNLRLRLVEAAKVMEEGLFFGHLNRLVYNLSLVLYRPVFLDEADVKQLAIENDPERYLALNRHRSDLTMFDWYMSLTGLSRDEAIEALGDDTVAILKRKRLHDTYKFDSIHSVLSEKVE